VIGCEYREVGVSVAALVREGHAREQVLADVRLALRRHLWPLPLGPQGPWPASGHGDGGYPLGRSFTARELEVVVARVAGVAGVSPVRLFARNGDGAFVELPGVGKQVSTFTLEAWQLPELSALAVVEGVDAPASLESPFGVPGCGDGPALYLPVVPEVC
jgi:hypothetical protein